MDKNYAETTSEWRIRGAIRQVAEVRNPEAGGNAAGQVAAAAALPDCNNTDRVVVVAAAVPGTAIRWRSNEAEGRKDSPSDDEAELASCNHFADPCNYPDWGSSCNHGDSSWL